MDNNISNSKSANIFEVNDAGLKAYRSPSLVIYGDLNKLTGEGYNSGDDLMDGSKTGA